MPGYKTHQAFGFVSSLGVLYILGFIGVHLSFLNIIYALLTACFYSILADIDIGTSKSRKIVMTGGLGLIFLCFVFDQKIIGISISVLLIAMNFLTHRGWTHTILAAALFSLPLLFLHWSLALIAFTSYISHLFIDGEIKMKK